MAYTLRLSDDELLRYRRMAEAAREQEATFWRQAGIVPGARVGDIGCGPGLTLCELAKAVAPGGHAVGVEREAEVAETAVAVLEREGIANAGVQIGDAARTGLPARSFDAVMMRHVLAHNGGREQEIVDHLASLVRPGGHVYLVDVDATAIRMMPPQEPELEELSERYWELHRRLGNDVSVGLRLPHLLAAARLEVVATQGMFNALPRTPDFRGPPWAARASLVEHGLASEADVERWDAAYERDGATPGLKLVYFPVIWAIGRRSAG